MPQKVKSLPPVWEIQVWSLGREDPPEKEMGTHSSILGWKIPWTEEPDRLQSIRSQGVRHSWAHTHTFQFNSVQFSSVGQLCPTLCDPMNCSMPGLPVHHQLPEFTQTHVHRVTHDQRYANQTTMRYHFMLVRMAAIQKSISNKCWRRCGENGTLLHCWWECKLVQPLWRTVWRFL